MDIEPDSVLDEVLARAKRLEKKFPFRAQLPISTVLHQSLKVLNISLDPEDIRLGHLLLAEQDINTQKAVDILNSNLNL